MGWGADRGGVVRGGEVFEIAEKLHHGGAETRRDTERGWNRSPSRWHEGANLT
jgi:hypothetical protein